MSEHPEIIRHQQENPETRRRMARERRGAESSVASLETLNYKTIY